MHKRKFLFPLLMVFFCACGAAVSAGASEIRQVGMIDLPGAPGFDGAAFANGMLLLSHAANDTVDIFNVARRRLAGKVNNMSRPKGIAVDQENGRVYVANSGANNLVVLSAADFQVQRAIALPFSPEELIYSPDSKLLYVSCPTAQRLLVVDPQLGTATHVADAGARPEYLAYDPGRNLLYVGLQDLKTIQAFDGELKPVKSFAVSGAMPTGIAYDQQLDRIYIAVRSAVVALDASSGAEVNRVPAPGGVDQLWLDASQHTLFAVSSGAVLLMHTAERLTLEEELPVDVKGHTLAFDSKTKFIYLPGGREGRSKLLILKQLTPGLDSPAAAETKPRPAEAKAQASR
jgi:DNA-binding beta-propeller fold protein YncE